MYIIYCWHMRYNVVQKHMHVYVCGGNVKATLFEFRIAKMV